MTFRDSWRASWEADGLHISGTTDLFPNDFSTVQLQFESDDRVTGVRTYRLVFSRDKEPFCGKDLIGPVVHVDRSAPEAIRAIRVVSPAGVEVGRVPFDPAAPRPNKR